MYLRRQEKQQDTARGAFYRIYSDKEYSGNAAGGKKALYEAAKGFFNKKRTLGPVVAFRRSLSESVRPEWLLWAISPALSQTDHNALRDSVNSSPIAPPWSR